jgi:hypothetical protein
LAFDASSSLDPRLEAFVGALENGNFHRFLSRIRARGTILFVPSGEVDTKKGPLLPQREARLGGFVWRSRVQVRH